MPTGDLVASPRQAGLDSDELPDPRTSGTSPLQSRDGRRAYDDSDRALLSVNPTRAAEREPAWVGQVMIQSSGSSLPSVIRVSACQNGR
jgi:hypothetical protein